MKNVIPIAKPIITKGEIDAATRVLRSGHLTEGEVVTQLEQIFASYCDTKYAVAVNSGTAALHTALYSLGIGQGDEVITTPFTFVATANAICMTGAKPVFVDILPDTFLINPKQIEAKITKKTKAIIPVNLYGQPADYQEIYAIAKKYKLFIIEDAAQSIGATYHGKRSGTFADLSCFSFYATKNIMCGEGGMITTNHAPLAKRARQFKNHGQSATARYKYNDIGYNYRMMDLLAAIVIEQLKKIDWIITKRQALARQYTEAFSLIKGIVTPIVDKSRTHVFHQYTIRVEKPFPLKRDELKNYLKKHGIVSNVYYPTPLYDFTHLYDGTNPNRQYPITELATQQVLSLPVHPLVRQIDVNRIIRTIRDYETS